MTSYRQVLGRKQTFSLLDIIHYKNVLRREIENYTLYKFIVNNFLLTEREVCTKKYRTKVFFVQTKPVGQALYKKTVLQCFFCTYRASEVDKKFIIWHSYAFILETNKKCLNWNVY
jgi:hypothetical protein